MKHCDECMFFKNVKEIKGIFLCEKNHKMNFKSPEHFDPHSSDWGFYRRGCKDRKIE